MKKIVFYFLALFSLILFILFVDIILSRTFLDSKHCVNYEQNFYELKKNCNGKYRFKKSFPLVEVFTDEIGQRVGKKKIVKDDKKKNIFIFGDSFTYGVGLQYEKTYVGLITEHFKEYNIFNFSLGSYSPSVYLYNLKKTLKKNIYPEKVIIFLDLTDVLDEGTRWTYDRDSEVARLISSNLINKPKQKNFIDRNFKISKNIFSFLNYNFRNLRENIMINLTSERKIKTSIQGSFTYTKQDDLNSRFWKEKDFEKGLYNLQIRLEEIIKISKKNNFELFLVIYPWAETLEFGQEQFSWSKYIENICSKDNCKLIDTIPIFTEYKNSNPSWSTDLYFLNDEHFNAKGARLLFDIIIKSIQ